MRIVFLPSLIAPVAEGLCFGGAEMAALALAEALAQRDHGVAMLGLRGTGGVGLASWPVDHATPVMRPGSTRSLDEEAAAPFRSLEPRLDEVMATGEIDVLHLHLNDPPALQMADRLARKYPNVAVVSTLHVAAVFPESSRVIRELQRARTPMVFVAPSRFALESYDLEPDGKRAFVVPNGVDVRSIMFAGGAPADGRLVWAGRRSREKGLIEALMIAKLSDRPITIAGARAPEATEEDDREVQRAMEGVFVEDAGLLARRDVPRLIAQASALLMTSSIAESHSLVAIESLAAGTPVIAFSVGALDEVIDHGATGFLIAPGDVRGACDAVNRIKEIKRARCREVALARFEHQVSVDAYETIYRAMKRSTT